MKFLLILLLFYSANLIAAGNKSGHCQHDGQDYLVGQRLFITNLLTGKPELFTCTKFNRGRLTEYDWFSSDTAPRSNDLLQQAKLKAIEAREKKRMELLEQEKKLKALEESQVKSKKPVVKAKPDPVQAEYQKLELIQQEYDRQILKLVQKNWKEPKNAGTKPDCQTRVRQGVKGEIIDVIFGRCPGTKEYRLSVEEAIFKSEPLPLPSIPELFNPQLTITFKPTS